MSQIWYTYKANVNRRNRSNTKKWQKFIKLTLKAKVSVESGLWMFEIHSLMVIDPCAKYGKPMSNENNYRPDKKTRLYATHCLKLKPKSFGPDTNLHRQTDRRTNRVNKYIFTPWSSFTGGIIIKKIWWQSLWKLFSHNLCYDLSTRGYTCNWLTSSFLE